MSFKEGVKGVLPMTKLGWIKLRVKGGLSKNFK